MTGKGREARPDRLKTKAALRQGRQERGTRSWSKGEKLKTKHTQRAYQIKTLRKRASAQRFRRCRTAALLAAQTALRWPGLDSARL